MRMNKVLQVALAVALTAGAAQAQVSKLNIVGTVNLYQTVPGASGNLVIDFTPPSTGVGTVFTPPGTTGNTGVFAAFPTSFPGLNLDFVFGTGGVPPLTTTPVDFLTMGGYTFTATSFGPGNIGGTPVFVTQVGTSVFALLSVDGYVNGPGLAANTPFVGGYSTQIPGTIAGIVNTIQTNVGPTGGIGNVSVSGTFTVTPTPEPASMALMATGLLGLVGVGMARRRNQA